VRRGGFARGATEREGEGVVVGVFFFAVWVHPISSPIHLSIPNQTRTTHRNGNSYWKRKVVAKEKGGAYGNFQAI